MPNTTNAVFRRKMQLKLLYPIKPAGYNNFSAGFFTQSPGYINVIAAFLQKMIFLAES
jgi:hypothetical protein